MCQTADKDAAVSRVDSCGSVAGSQGASLRLVRRWWRVAAKSLPVFAQLIWKRLEARGGSLPQPSLQSWRRRQRQDTTVMSHSKCLCCSAAAQDEVLHSGSQHNLMQGIKEMQINAIHLSEALN